MYIDVAKMIKTVGKDFLKKGITKVLEKKEFTKKYVPFVGPLLGVALECGVFKYLDQWFADHAVGESGRFQTCIIIA